jgi:hypothetical protein
LEVRDIGKIFGGHPLAAHRSVRRRLIKKLVDQSIDSTVLSLDLLGLGFQPRFDPLGRPLRRHINEKLMARISQSADVIDRLTHVRVVRAQDLDVRQDFKRKLVAKAGVVLEETLHP